MPDSRFEFVGGGSDIPSNAAAMDVVFIHGLNGDCCHTWTHANNEFWPRWLAEDYPAVNVYSAGYDSSFTTKILKGDGGGLVDVATMLLDRIMSRKTKSKPLLFVTHSFGGLVAKQLLRKSSEASNRSRKRICQQTRGIVFVGTPHQGAQLATSLKNLFGLAISRQIKELSYAGASLIDLSQWFSNWAPKKKLPVWSYYEVDELNGIILVDQVTANPNVLGCDPIALQSNHVEMVKLSDRNAQLYQSLIAAISETLDAIALEVPTEEPQTALQQELDAYVTHAPADRRTLAEKLEGAGRSDEIQRAERQKERFSIDLQRSIAQPAAVRRYTRLLSNIETRFQRHVAPSVAAGKGRAIVDKLVQEAVLDPTLSADDADGGSATQSFVESAYYYLAGNCHIGWGQDD
jgi:pimeloyl-ACP methyl ester carboxylesterase